MRPRANQLLSHGAAMGFGALTVLLLLKTRDCACSGMQFDAQTRHTQAVKAVDETLLTPPDETTLARLLERASEVADVELHRIDPSKSIGRGEGMGHVGEVPEEVLFLQRVAQTYLGGKSAHICEIGFNAGHSAIIWLHTLPDATYTVFDRHELAWSDVSIEFVAQLFPGQNRFTYIKGEAGLGPALTDYRLQILAGVKRPCDLLAVDGDHSEGPARADFENGALITTQEGYVFADDCSSSFPGVQNAWSIVKETGLVQELACEEIRDRQFNGYSKGWCIGQYHRK